VSTSSTATEGIESPSARRLWVAVVRLLERDERVFAVLLAFVMVGGLATLGLVPLGPRRVDVYSLVRWFAAYKAGVLALVTVNPQATRKIFIGALAVDLLLVFALLFLTGGAYSLFYLLFFPLVAVNAYYFGPRVGLMVAILAGLLYAAAAALAPPWVGWTPVMILSGLMGLPAFALGPVAERERRARAEVERLNKELLGTLTRLQAAQEELLVAERMATVGRLSLKVAHEVRNPIAAIELNAEMLGDIVRERAGPDMDEAATLVTAIRDQVNALDALTDEYLAFARFPRPHFEEDSVNEMVMALVEFVRPVATKHGVTVDVVTDPTVPPMSIDRTLLRQAVLNLVKNGLEALPQGGVLTVTTGRADDAVTIAVGDTGPGITPEVGKRLFEQFFTTKPQGTGLGLYISRQIVEEHGGELGWTSELGAPTTFTLRLPIKRSDRG
jgi:signal transduction histidine kinase